MNTPDLFTVFCNMLVLLAIGFALFWAWFQFLDKLTIEKMGRAVFNDLAASQPEAWRASMLKQGWMTRWAFRKATMKRLSDIKAEIDRRQQA